MRTRIASRGAARATYFGAFKRRDEPCSKPVPQLVHWQLTAAGGGAFTSNSISLQTFQPTPSTSFVYMKEERLLAT
jgi:hypothetical protein